MFKHNNILLITIALASCFSLLLSSNLIPAYAFSITYYDNSADGSGATAADAITRIGNKIAISDFTSNTVTFRDANNPNDMIGQIAVGGDIYQLHPNSGATRIYGFGDTSIFEFDPVNYATLRTVAHTCTITEGLYFDTANDNIYCSQTDEEVVRISMNSMTITFISTTLNAGATPCVVTEDLQYDQASNTMFASCTGPTRLVAIEGFTTSGTPDLAVSPSGLSGSLGFSSLHDNIVLCKTSGQPQSFNYTAGVSLVLWQSLDTTSETCTNPSQDDLVYDAVSDRYFYWTSNDQIRIRDGADPSTTLFAGTIGTAGSEEQLYVYSNDLLYGANVVGSVAGTDYMVFDLTGIALGSGGTDEPNTTGIDCTQPENANILTCRLGGDGTLVGAGQFIVGNVNGTTGLTPIICATGIVDCVANPDMKTNGVGYLLVTIALAIIIGILWVASRGDLNSIPTFIWFIATLAVVGAFTLMDLIDATFLVITVVFIIALAAAKARGLFGGGDFK